MSSVSVIVPIYNAEKYLHECLTSILNELETTDELILIDDGSKDNSYSICEQYKKDNVCVIKNTNHGVSYTRNCGIQRASKEYLLFVDSDDFLMNGWRASIEKGTQTQTDIVFFSKEDIVLPTKNDLVKSILFLPGSPKTSIVAGACWYKLFQRSFISANNIQFREGIINGEDGLFVLESTLKTDSYTVVTVPDFYYYRPNDASATHRYNEKYNTSNLLYISNVENMLEQHNFFSPQERTDYISLIHARGLYILASKIALITDIAERKAHYSLFEQDVYVRLYNEYTPSADCSKMVRDTFKLLKKRKFDSAIRMINFRRTVYRAFKKLKKQI